MCVLWEIISLIRYPTAWCGSERTTALLLIKVILKHLSLPLFGPCVGARVRDFWAVDVRRLVPDSIVSLLTPLFAERQKSRIKQKPLYHSHTQKPTRWQRKQKQTVRPPCVRGGFASTLRAGPGFSPTCSEKTYRFGIVFFFFFPFVINWTLNSIFFGFLKKTKQNRTEQNGTESFWLFTGFSLFIPWFLDTLFVSVAGVTLATALFPVMG